MIKLLFIIILSMAQEPPADPGMEAPLPPPVEEPAPDVGQQPAQQPAEQPAQQPAQQAPPPQPAPGQPAPAAPAPAPVPFQTENIFNEDESLVEKLTKPFVYDRSGRDPFNMPEGKIVPLAPGEVYGPLLELQEISLADIKLKGIFLNPTLPRAFIEYEVNGKKVKKQITVRDYVGEDFGIVSSIRDGQVIIVQTLEQGNQKSTTTRVLSIRK